MLGKYVRALARLSFVLVSLLSTLLLAGTASAQIDSAGNDFIVGCPGDMDADGVCDDVDNCPADANADQANSDTDAFGDACDNCDLVDNPGQEDCDNDGTGDACAPDCNNNSLPDSCDIANATSFDVNSNGIPDECEPSGGTPFCFGDGSSGPCPCGNNSVPGQDRGCRNSSGVGGKLVGSGITSLTGDQLVLSISNLPGAQGGAFFLRYSTPIPAVVHADGLRCSGPFSTRFPQGGVHPVPAGSGNASYGPGLVSGVPGTTIGTNHYQAFYRQKIETSPCGATTWGINVTNALTVVWGP
jgi:hypothetical protein